MAGIFNMFIHSETTQNVFFVIPKWLAIWNVRRYLELGSDKGWQKIETMNLTHNFILEKKKIQPFPEKLAKSPQIHP